jgi:iron-sulfur cluster repair protein YtfE (RIC family)
MGRELTFKEMNMQSILEYMSGEHARCDEYFTSAEEYVAEGNWEQASTQFDRFRDELDKHFRMEEQILFPQFERATGNAGGPSAVMRMEHEQLRELLKSLAVLVMEKDKDGFLGTSETLLILMQQHNMKEEQMLYPMTDRMLAGVAGEIIAAMKEIEH